MALPYDITKRIRQHFASNDDINDGKDSFYIQLEGRKYEMRISNHCTHLWTWHERRNGKMDDITRISIVFEEKDTYNKRNLVLKKHRKVPIKVHEFVYRIADPAIFTNIDVGVVIKSIKQALLKSKIYQDETNKMLYYKERVSINPIASNNIKESKYMKKNRIRLTESQLNRVIKESVKNVLSEEVRFKKRTDHNIHSGIGTYDYTPKHQYLRKFTRGIAERLESFLKHKGYEPSIAVSESHEDYTDSGYLSTYTSQDDFVNFKIAFSLYKSNERADESLLKAAQTMSKAIKMLNAMSMIEDAAMDPYYIKVDHNGVFVAWVSCRLDYKYSDKGVEAFSPKHNKGWGYPTSVSWETDDVKDNYGGKNSYGGNDYYKETDDGQWYDDEGRAYGANEDW